VEIALTPEELEGLDDDGIRQLYEEKLAAARSAKASGREDFSDLVAGKAAQQKRKLAQQKEAQAAKRSKTDFKF
jgi:splicing factor 3B subunit 2